MCAPDKSKELPTKQQQEGVNPQSKQVQQGSKSNTHGESPFEARTLSQMAKFAMYGVVVGIPISAFSLIFPLLLFREAATQTYLPASYAYVPEISHFDNTFLTYGTDYLIAFAMMAQIVSFPKVVPRNRIAAFRSKALLGSYAGSVLFGGLCHQFYTTCEMRQTWHFRFLWTLCVGFVTVAPGFMGAIATELVRQDEQLGLASMPSVPAWFWTGFGTACTMATALGFFSFQRPACDIFVAGVTQFPSTFYLMAMLAFGMPTFNLTRATRLLGLIGFIMMSVTLPTYPLAVQYTDLSLGMVNGLLHVWLLTAWTSQGTTLRRICKALQEADEPPAPSVPIKRKVV